MLPCPIPTIVKGERGALFMNVLRDHVKGCVLVPPSSQLPVTPAARTGSANGTYSTSIETPLDSWVEVFTAMGVDGAAVNSDVVARQCVMISGYLTGQRRLMRRPVNVTHVFGTNLNPLYLDDPFSEPLLLPPQSVLKFDFINPSTAGAGSFRFAMEARRVGADALKDKFIAQGLSGGLGRRRKVYPMWLPLNTDSEASDGTSLGVPGVRVPAGGQIDTQFCTFNDSPAEVTITRIMGSALTTGIAGDATALFAMDLWDARTYRKLNSDRLAFNCGAGPAAFPFNLKTQIVIKSNQVIKARIYNLVTDQPTDVFLTMQGVAVE